MTIRTITAAAFAALALAGAACGDGEATEDPGRQSDAPVNTDTPSAEPEEGATPTNEDNPGGGPDGY